MSPLFTRVVSAIFAALLLAGSYFFFDKWGVLTLGCILVMVGAWEYAKICLSPVYKSNKIFTLYLALCGVLLLLFSFSNLLILPTFASIVCLFFTGSLWLSRDRIKIDSLQKLLTFAATGFIYCTLFPSFAFKILLKENGIQLFVTLLIIVFAGDIFAYFGGKTMGKHRLMPALSPKKTVEGCFSGLAGAFVCALASNELFNFNWHFIAIFILSIITSFAAQTGDLFESLLKRNAGVKDSGRIMPGHGGVLDRLDGVYFGAPVFYSILYFMQILNS